MPAREPRYHSRSSGPAPAFASPDPGCGRYQISYPGCETCEVVARDRAEAWAIYGDAQAKNLNLREPGLCITFLGRV